MPRIPRVFMDTSFFHVMCQGIKKECIFKKEKDKYTYMHLLKKYINNHLKIIAYCIMDNHVHLLIHVDKVEFLTEFMHQVNTVYAIYYNKEYKRVGYVFRDRFKSEPIESNQYLIQCIDYIHLNPVKAGICFRKDDYKYSSYIEYLGKKYLIEEASIKLVYGNNNYINTSNTIDVVFLENESKEETCIRIIRDFLLMKNYTIDDLSIDLKALKELIIKLRANDISYRVIENKIGIDKSKINRLMKK